MSLFYTASPKMLLNVRNEIFLKKGIPALNRNNFEQSPYTGARFGKYDASLYAYDLCRINNGNLETITTYISKKDNWIKIYLNIFKLNQSLYSLGALKGLDGIQFSLPPNSLTKMRLRIDDFKGMPLFRTVDHKIKSFYTETGFQKRVDELSALIAQDLNDIDSFVRRWHELHDPMLTDCEGKQITI